MENLVQLKWQVDAGADEAIENEPIKRMANIPEELGSVTEAKQSPAREASGRTEMESLARRLADDCKTLEELEDAVRKFDGLAIKKTATNTVFADGNRKAKIMIVGEAPGANEDLEGIPFCGASGKLMDDLFGWAGFSRKENLYICNTLFWRPPGNRRPTPEELAVCKPFVEKHIALIAPKLLIMVGGTATLALLDDKSGITKLRGRYFDYRNGYFAGEIKATALFHPSYLLRQPSQKRLFWQDLLSIKQFLKEKA